MEYTEALNWVHGLPRLAETPGPHRMNQLLAALGNPHRRLRFVHVAGTNGKGSTVAMLASILKEAGCRVGANISPYVLEFRERFQLNGEMIPHEELAGVLQAVRDGIAEAGVQILEFEAVTAAALYWFAQKRCDIVCLEAGIGGASDTTNVVQNTLVACITKIAMDHTELLGESIEEIARDKSGIIKRGCTVVSYPGQPQKAAVIVAKTAQSLECELVVPQAEDFHYYKGRPFENRIYYGGYDLQVPFPGRHQAKNAAVALEAALALWRNHGFAIEDEHIIKGIRAARIPARIEVLSTSPLLILDGAHNTDGARALADTLRAEKVRGLSVVAGVLRDKQAEDILRLIAPFAARLYAITPASPRALPAQELAAMAKADFSLEATACPDVPTALRMARAGGGGVLVCGSLYLASEARPHLVQESANGPGK